MSVALFLKHVHLDLSTFSSHWSMSSSHEVSKSARDLIPQENPLTNEGQEFSDITKCALHIFSERSQARWRPRCPQCWPAFEYTCNHLFLLLCFTLSLPHCVSLDHLPNKGMTYRSSLQGLLLERGISCTNFHFEVIALLYVFLHL